MKKIYKFLSIFLLSFILLSCGNTIYTPLIPVDSKIDTINTITIVPDSPELKVGEVLKLTAIITQIDGTVIKDANILWSSENPNIANIDEKGILKAIKAGKTEILAKYLDKKTSIFVNILDNSSKETSSKEKESSQTGISETKTTSNVEKVIIKPYNYDFIPYEIFFTTLNESIKLTAEAYDKNNVLIKDATFTWASEDTNIATVEGTEIINEAIVKSLKTGVTYITATSNEKISNKIKVIVPSGKVNANISFMLP